jgi:hypothetical protein
MAADPTQTNIDDIGQLQQFAVGNLVSFLRIKLDMYDRRIVTLQRRLTNLQAEEMSVKSKALNNIDLSYINKMYGAGNNTTVNPTQAMNNFTIAPDPHQNVGYDKFQIYSKVDNIKDLESGMNKVTTDILELESLIRDYTKSRDDLQAQVQSMEQEQQTRLSDTASGRVQRPTQTDIEKDRIARSRVSDIMNIYQIHEAYRKLTTPDPEKPTIRGFPDGDAKITKDLMTYKQIFWAAAQNFPDLLSSTDPTKRLDLADPGSDNNATILTSLLNITRGAAVNTKTVDKLDKLVKDLTAVTNNTLISHGIGRKPVPIADPANSMREMTKSYPAAVIKLPNGKYWGEFKLPSLSSSVLKWWKRKNASFYIGLPPCEDQSFISDEDAVKKNEAVAKARKLVNENLGQEKYKAAKDKAEKAFKDNFGKVEFNTPKAQSPDAPQVITDALDTPMG